MMTKPNVYRDRYCSFSAVISKGDPSIGIHVGQYAFFDERDCRLFDYNGQRIPLKTIEFILLSGVTLRPSMSDSPTLIVAAKDMHYEVNKFDRIVAHGKVTVTTSRPSVRLDCPTRASDSVVSTKHILNHFEVLEIL